MEVSDLDDQDDEIDWEELESRLYSQIYHAPPQEDDDPVFLKTINMNTETIGNKKKYRYFEKPKSVPNQSHTPLPSYLSLQNTTQKPENYSISTIQKHVSAVQTETRSTSSIAPTHVHNNITVNQYSIPPLILQSEAVATEPLAFFAPWHANAFKVIEKNKILDKILDKKRKRKHKLLRRLDRRRNNLRLANHKTTQNSVTIFVDSDISDDECVVVEDDSAKKPVTRISTGFPKKYDENNGGEKPEDDDEIIYIPPPPVEIINVDLDETEKVTSEGSTDKLDSPPEIPHKDTAEKFPTDAETKIPTGEEPKGFLGSPVSTSNDFLDNISLHGSDCNKREFVKPSHPIEYCETESSCSTNEHSRDFSNTVKTIVFDEVDFPREDIFSDKNLEDFGSFITPKRTTRNSKGSPSSKKTNEAEPNSEKNVTSSDSSSSESDYEEIANIITRSMSRGNKKNLPNLSLMMPPDTPKKVPRKKKSAGDFFSNENPESKKIKPSQTTKKTPKVKRKLKKRKISGKTENSELEDGNNSELSAGEKQVSSDKDKKKKKKKRQSEGDDNSNETTSNEGKQKKRKSLKSDDLTKLTSTPIPTEKTKKKKKKISTSNDQDAVTEDLTEKKLTNSTTDTNENTDSNPDQAVPSSSLNPSEIISTEVEKPIITKTPEEINTELSKSPLPIPELNISDLIVVDETFNKEAIEVILSESESEGCDFQTLDDVGDDMELANCTTQHESLSNKEVVPVGDDTGSCLLPATAPTLDYKNFDVDFIQKNQSDDPEKWQISYRDRSLYLNLDRVRGPRCNRCRHFGHIAIRCPEKPNAPSCTLCGEPNHQEPRCPNKRCTQCGNQGNFSTSYCWKCFKFRHSCCNLCNMRGHVEYSCPDLWRRYHSTTSEGPIVTTQGSILTRDKQWCSGCAGQGHLEHECDYYNREFPPTTPYIVRYDDNLAKGDSRRRLEGPSQIRAPNMQTQDFLAPNVVFPEFVAPEQAHNFVAPNVGFPEFVAPERTHNFVAPNVGQPDTPVLRANPYAMPLLFLPQRVLQNTVEIGPSSVVKSTSSGPKNIDFSYTHVVGDTEIDLTEGTRIKHLIMTAQYNVVHEFIAKELDELNNKVANCDYKMLRKKLFKYDKMPIEFTQTKEIREKRFWFRIFNMAIFGVRGLFDGKINYNVLKSFLGQKETTSMYTWKRKALFNAYSYIFGYDKRKLNYYRVLQLMMQKQDEGKLKKFSQCT